MNNDRLEGGNGYNILYGLPGARECTFHMCKTRWLRRMVYIPSYYVYPTVDSIHT